MQMGLRDANQRFAKAMRAVRRGEDVVLTDRGKPLAVIRRIATDDEQARLEALSTSGLIQLAAIPEPMSTPRWKPIALKGESIAETIRRDRDEDS
jgi:prevent-host-death family protein